MSKDWEQFRVSLILRQLEEPSAQWSRLWRWLLAPPHDRNHDSVMDEDDQSEIEKTDNE